MNKNHQENQPDEGGSTLFVCQGTKEDFDKIISLFEEEQLSELLQMTVLDVGAIDKAQLSAINLRQWFQNEFAEAIQLGWLTIAEIFGITNTSPAFRSNAVKRSKQIQLGDRTLALILDLSTDDNQEISIYMGVYPLGEQTYLPENLHIIVFFEPGEPSPINVPSNSEGIIQELLLSPGEEFSIQLSLDDDTVTEYFTI